MSEKKTKVGVNVENLLQVRTLEPDRYDLLD